MKLSVREAHIDDIEMIVRYFLESSPQYLSGMGAESSLLPREEEWIRFIICEMHKTRKAQEIFYVIWEVNNSPVGHSNINNISFGNEAFMHLHLWNAANRQQGWGTRFVMESLEYYFSYFNLKQIKCEPFELNLAPAKTLEKAGFEFQRTYRTIPSTICFRQQVNSYLLTRKKWEKMKQYSE